MDKSLVALSRFLSRVLRHEPARLGLQLDEQGWVEVDSLLAAARRERPPMPPPSRSEGGAGMEDPSERLPPGARPEEGLVLTRAILERIVAENEKRRFQFSEDGLRIRACQGHSVPVNLGLIPREPPETLFHGTSRTFLGSIQVQGLVRGRRHHVHLSADPVTARQVGGRHGPPLVLVVSAGEMHRQGFPFFRSENGVWLTERVPPGFLSLPEVGPHEGPEVLFKKD